MLRFEWNGALANRKRGSVLPKVYEALEMSAEKAGEAGVCGAMKASGTTVPVHPCKGRLRFAGHGG
ncbi:hypothetical protein EWM60_20375 [Candidatus Erwinia dacicola]|nr:hypothetical protein [Candidatus Erwinia dacicola]